MQEKQQELQLEIENATAAAEAVGEINQVANEILIQQKAEVDAQLVQLEEQKAEQIISINKSEQQKIREEEEKTAKLKKLQRESAISGAGDLASALSDFAEEGSDEAKAFAIFAATINTYQAITNALANTLVPPPGPQLAAVAAGIAGLTQVRKIASTNKAAKGTYLKDGEGTETSDSIPAMLSRGETVINARSSKAFLPLLSQINQWGGGVAFATGGHVNDHLVQRFAGGGVADLTNDIINQNINTTQLVEVTERQQPVLVLQDFQAVEGTQVRVENNLKL